MRVEYSQTISKVLKSVLIIYMILTLAYTAQHIYAAKQGWRNLGSSIYPRAGTEVDLRAKQELLSPMEPIHASFQGPHGQGNFPEDAIVSKMFSSTLGPSNVTPYFYRAESTFEQEDITLSTLVTVDRLPVLSRLATNYKGPISAAIHVREGKHKKEILNEIHKAYMDNDDMKQYVDMHLIVDGYDRQFNMWRNVARLFARTDFLMMLDVDFHLCTNVRRSVLENPTLLKKLREGRTALVVPAFEFVSETDGTDWNTFPTTKPGLLSLVNKKKVQMFHKFFPRGHEATNYPKWFKHSGLYKVERYTSAYEPYIIFKKNGAPFCDERFIGYGSNKAACLYEMFLSGIEFEVLPSDFLIHQTHHYPLETRHKERLFNKWLFEQFRTESCVRYMRTFIANGEWNSDRANNLKFACPDTKVIGLLRPQLT